MARHPTCHVVEPVAVVSDDEYLFLAALFSRLNDSFVEFLSIPQKAQTFDVAWLILVVM
jgi:hypothetical protein